MSALPWDVDGGTEIRLFDPQRNPPDWTDLMRPTDCAVFLRNQATSASLGTDGQPFRKLADTTCIVFDRLDEVQRFCESRVQALPHLRCEIYDAQGLADAPLLVIIHPDRQRKEEAGSFWSRRRKLIACTFSLVAVPLFWLGMRQSNSSDLETFLAFSCIFTALRFIYWDFGLKHREQERQRRLESHRKMERRGD